MRPWASSNHAVAAGAQRILYTSHMGSNADSAFAPMRDHAATEAALQQSGVAFTSLRNGFYAASALWFLGAAFQSGALALPEDGPVSWTAHADLAEAAAIALADEGRLAGVTPPLTAAQALDFGDLAGIASEVTGREITRTVIGDDEFRQMSLSRGMPEAQVDMGLGLFIACRAREFSTVDPTLEQLLGRRPQTFRDVLAEAQASRED
jgi:uncharacterized protein YbjT (DUF2867 family)